MHAIQQLLAFLGPRQLRVDEMSGARRLSLAALAFLVALLLVALWGIAAGSVGGHFALVNAVSVPLLLLVSSAAALPVVLIVVCAIYTRLCVCHKYLGTSDVRGSWRRSEAGW